MKNFVLAIDAGTTSSRAIIFNNKGETVGVSQYEFTQHFPKEGWVEHDPIEIWETQLKAIREVMEKTNISASQIHAMGITNQRETTVIWDRKTGKPVYNAIVWQDRRTATICEEIEKRGKQNSFTTKQVCFLTLIFLALK